jgi:hypothetical protein
MTRRPVGRSQWARRDEHRHGTNLLVVGFEIVSVSANQP